MYERTGCWMANGEFTGTWAKIWCFAGCSLTWTGAGALAGTGAGAGACTLATTGFAGAGLYHGLCAIF